MSIAQRLRAASIAGLLAAACARGQTAAPLAQGGDRIAGRVLDAVSGEPVRRATVNVMSQEYKGIVASGVTDNDGRFAFDNIPAGKYPMTAAKRGYLMCFYDEHEGFNSAIVTGKGLDTTDLQFHIAPQAVLRGVVSGDGGDPVERAEVMLFKRPAHEGDKIRQVSSAQTDDTGAFEFTRLEAGEYLIAVRGEPWFAQHGVGRRDAGQQEQAGQDQAGQEQAGQNQTGLDVAYPLTFYDSTIDENAATALRLEAGSREEVDINLHAVPAVRIKEPEAERNPRVPAMLRQRVFGELLGVPTSEVGAGGRTRVFVGVAPGNYELEIGNPPRMMSLNASADTEIDTNAGTPTVTVSGTLAMLDGGAVPSQVELDIQPEDGQAEQVPAQVQGGRFELEGVAPGTWSVHAPNAGKRLSVIGVSVIGSAGGATVEGDQFVVKDQPVSLAVTVAYGTTRIEGFARKDGKPAAGVLVALVPRAASAYRTLAQFDEADLDGSFSLRDVAPGEYTVVAIEDGWKLDRQRRESLERYLPQGSPVHVREQSPAIVTLSAPVKAVPR